MEIEDTAPDAEIFQDEEDDIEIAVASNEL